MRRTDGRTDGRTAYRVEFTETKPEVERLVSVIADGASAVAIGSSWLLRHVVREWRTMKHQ